MKFTSESKFFIGIIGATLAIIAGAIYLFSKPTSQVPALSKQDLIAQDTYTTGNASASAYLVEFSDFQCPACKAFQPAVDIALDKYRDKLLFAYRHFPLDKHEYALNAALTAEAAGEQGKFWEMEKLLFDNQEKFGDSLWKDLAKQLGLDEKKFDEAFTSKTLMDKITRDRAYGDQIGVNSTPTFYLNGKKLELTSQADLIKAVEEEVK